MRLALENPNPVRAGYEGKIALLRRISGSIAAGQDASFPTFFVWHRPDLSEFVVCRLEEWVGGPKRALGLGSRSFAELIGNLPKWDGDTPAVPAAGRRCPST